MSDPSVGIILKVEMVTQDCVFCKIVTGEIPSYKIYEDSDFLAFLDTRPLNSGHAQVIPKRHFRWTWEVPNFGDYWEAVRKVAQGIMKALGADHVSFVTLGYEVAHAHIWVVPRFPNDGHGGLIDWSNVNDIKDSKMQEIARKIRKAVK